MTDIPLNADVECADGPGGKSTYVIVNPTTQQVTHFVVKEGGLHPTERLVPIDWVVETTHDLIRLRCTRDELAAMEPFFETGFIRRDIPHVDPVMSALWDRPYAVSQTTVVRVQHKHIPPGELAMRQGARVEATDGYVGRVDEFLVDSSEHITHLVLREGHLWGQKEVTIPVSEIHHIEEDTVYLKLDRHAIESLPTVPVRRR